MPMKWNSSQGHGRIRGGGDQSRRCGRSSNRDRQHHPLCGVRNAVVIKKDETHRNVVALGKV